ncbi:MAG: diheme cytochrome c precursor [Phycisphaerales bacterium]
MTEFDSNRHASGPHTDEQHRSLLASRGTQLFLVAVIGVSLIGLIVGMRQGVPSHDQPDFDHDYPKDVTDNQNTIPATAYKDFDRRNHGPNRDWRSNLASLTQPEIDLFEAVFFTEEQRQEFIKARATRRAFDGAPPTIPHPADQMTSASCVACHANGLHINGVYAPPMSHNHLTNCTQCHVEQQATDLQPRPVVRSLFTPLETTGRGSRAWDGAPPTIPHATFMREDCMSCHGPAGNDPIRTSHPWQTSCVQCHAPSAALDQGVFDTDPAFLTPPVIREPQPPTSTP